MSQVKVDPIGKIAIVSGSNRGIGKGITIELLERGAKKIYATALSIAFGTFQIIISKYAYLG